MKYHTLFFLKFGKMLKNLSFAAVLIGALTVKPNGLTLPSHLLITFANSVNSANSSTDNLCKQFGPRSGPTKCCVWSGSKLFDAVKVFLNLFLFKLILKKIR